MMTLHAQSNATVLTPYYGVLTPPPHPPPITLYFHPLALTTKAKAWPKGASVQIKKMYTFPKTWLLFDGKFWNMLSLLE